MVKPADRRAAKYAAKIDADVQRTRILALKTDMTANQAPASASLATLEAEIKKILEGNTTPPWGYEIPMLLNVARKLFKLSVSFSANTFEAEAGAWLDQCAARGIEAIYLTPIAAYFGVTYP